MGYHNHCLLARVRVSHLNVFDSSEAKSTCPYVRPWMTRMLNIKCNRLSRPLSNSNPIFWCLPFTDYTLLNASLRAEEDHKRPQRIHQ